MKNKTRKIALEAQATTDQYWDLSTLLARRKIKLAAEEAGHSDKALQLVVFYENILRQLRQGNEEKDGA